MFIICSLSLVADCQYTGGTIIVWQPRGEGEGMHAALPWEPLDEYLSNNVHPISFFWWRLRLQNLFGIRIGLGVQHDDLPTNFGRKKEHAKKRSTWSHATVTVHKIIGQLTFARQCSIFEVWLLLMLYTIASCTWLFLTSCPISFYNDLVTWSNGAAYASY